MEDVQSLRDLYIWLVIYFQNIRNLGPEVNAMIKEM